ncbi:signal peptidase I [Enterococcus sp. BWT-B8]|uniref:signal peptidase I n=1 Tax=Enterococcus sp. BWT-B8 TaxID=2885157 RepID=UPI001E4A72C2|nr:signal peptidase I [Enterococcus sp. BWT-B8]MCB5952572.1 signal peptidase I [Enterococcus sp. BWT-B8]
MSRELKQKNSTHQRRPSSPQNTPSNKKGEVGKHPSARKKRKRPALASASQSRLGKANSRPQKKAVAVIGQKKRSKSVTNVSSNQKTLAKRPASTRKKKPRESKSAPKRVLRKKRTLLHRMRTGAGALWAAFLAAVLLFLFVSSLFVKITKVNGYSMMPTLQDNHTVLVQKTKAVNRFDLVLFRRGETQQVRRIIGLPEEQIKYSEDFLYVNGEVVDEKFIIDEINEAQKNGGQYTADFDQYDISREAVIPKNCYLVLGDNREYGYDSRDYGLIDREQVIGVVRMRLLPLNDLTAF